MNDWTENRYKNAPASAEWMRGMMGELKYEMTGLIDCLT